MTTAIEPHLRTPGLHWRHGLGLTVLGAAVLILGCEPDRAPLSPTDRPEADAGGKSSSFLTSNPTGQMGTVSTAGAIELGNPFFQSLGTNGRTCASCHLQASAFGLSAQAVQAAFAARGGADPLFAPVDGANCPSVTPAGGATGYSLILNQGLIRVGLTVPTGAEFTITAVHDPYGCAFTGSPAQASVYRRPLPTVNLRFLSAVMFDGRETVQPLTDRNSFPANLRTSLLHQAMDATLGHAQAVASPTVAQLNAIVDFELGLFSAQYTDNAAGVLEAERAKGGPDALVVAPYFPGINDPLGDNPTGVAFNPNVFTLYSSWQSLGNSGRWVNARKTVARGQAVFNTHPLSITGVAGLNDDLGIGAINGTCTTCHDTPNIGNHSRPVPLDIGTSHVATNESDSRVLAALGRLSMPDLPVFRLACTTGPLAGTTRFTSDPGRALITGKCADIGRIKGPVLRGLAARAPYFHNGAAATLDQVVEFYDQRFQMGLTDPEKADLLAFLKAL
jgi:cytochrome c peroxidase